MCDEWLERWTIMDKDGKFKSTLGNDKNLENDEPNDVTNVKSSDMRNTSGDKRHDLDAQKKRQEETARKNPAAKTS